MDRMDLPVDVPAVKVSDLNNQGAGESSATVRERISKSREIQAARFKSLTDNPHRLKCAGGYARKRWRRSQSWRRTQELLNKAMDAHKFSARAYTGFWRVARTVADLRG